MAYMQINRTSSGGISVKRPTCTHCGLMEHTVDKCYKKDEYPLAYKPVQY